MHEAMLFESLEQGRVRCALCAHRCVVAPGERGVCGVRENRDGALYSLVYGQLVSQALDPVEKKPLYHFYPGTTALSIATVGCNLSCGFCQNADISQMPRDRRQIAGRETAPAEVVKAAVQHGARSIAYTYTEPTVFFEYSYDIAQLAHASGVANIYVSNGYMSAEMLDLIASPGAAPLIDAANIDLKSFHDRFYRQQCGARLQPVLDSLVTLKKRGVWVEVTTLVIPGLNDGEEELGDIAAFVAQELGVDTPWHVSRFHPTYRMTDRPLTPVDTVERARAIGLSRGLRYVYEGNTPTREGGHTYCPGCGAVVVRRSGYTILHKSLVDGACADCGTRLDGVGL